MSRLAWMSALAAAYVLLALAAPAGAIDTGTEDELFRFRAASLDGSGAAPAPAALELRCARALTEYGHDTPERFYFAAEDDARGAEFWALAGFPVTDPRQLWTGEAFSGDVTVPPTPEWGRVYDRNGDGRIDWMSYIESTVFLVPEGGLPPEMVSDGPAGADAARIEGFYNDNIRATFVHTIDMDFDGQPETFLAVPGRDGTSWSEGAMLVSRDASGAVSCTWHSDHGGPPRPCAGEDGYFKTTDTGPGLGRDVNIDGLTDFFALLTEVAGDCDFAPAGIAAQP